MIIIEIKNPMEIAKRESALAKALCRFAPNLIRRKVEENIAEQIKNSLSERGIEINILIRSPEE